MTDGMTTSDDGSKTGYFCFVTEPTEKEFNSTAASQTAMQLRLAQLMQSLTLAQHTHFPGADNVKACFLLDGCDGLSYQKLWGKVERDWIPTENNASTLVNLLSMDKVAVCIVAGARGLGVNLQGLADLLRSSHAAIVYINAGIGAQADCEIFDAQDLVMAIDSHIALRKLTDKEEQDSAAIAIAQTAYNHVSNDLRLKILAIQQEADTLLKAAREQAALFEADTQSIGTKAADLECVHPTCTVSGFQNVAELVNHCIFDHTPAYAPTMCSVCQKPHMLYSHCELRDHITAKLRELVYCVSYSCSASCLAC